MAGRGALTVGVDVGSAAAAGVADGGAVAVSTSVGDEPSTVAVTLCVNVGDRESIELAV